MSDRESDAAPEEPGSTRAGADAVVGGRDGIPEEAGLIAEEKTAPVGEPTRSRPAAAPPAPEETRVEVHRVFMGTGLFWGLVLATVLTVIVIILAVQNTQQITVQFLTFEGGAPLIAVLLASLLVGVILDEIVGWAYRARRRRILTDKEELKRLRATRESDAS